MKPDYDTTIARIAGNIMSGMVTAPGFPEFNPGGQAIVIAVRLARLIVAEVKRTGTEPPKIRDRDS